jgi:hypothetical protein
MTPEGSIGWNSEVIDHDLQIECVFCMPSDADLLSPELLQEPVYEACVELADLL